MVITTFCRVACSSSSSRSSSSYVFPWSSRSEVKSRSLRARPSWSDSERTSSMLSSPPASPKRSSPASSGRSIGSSESDMLKLGDSLWFQLGRELRDELEMEWKAVWRPKVQIGIALAGTDKAIRNDVCAPLPTSYSKMLLHPLQWIRQSTIILPGTDKTAHCPANTAPGSPGRLAGSEPPASIPYELQISVGGTA